MTKVQPISSAAERLMKASTRPNFNFRNYASKRGYSISSARLEGTVLGANRPSLKILCSDTWDNAIFAVMKSGKLLGARSIKSDNFIDEKIFSILDKLCQKGKMKKEEYNIVKEQLPF